MARVKRGVPAHARHVKVLNITKGQRGAKHRLFRRANEAMLASLRYSTYDRRDRKGEMRKLWIIRINAGARQNGISYSRLINGLHAAGVEVNRKLLADMAVSDPAAFSKLVEVAKTAPAAA